MKKGQVLCFVMAVMLSVSATSFSQQAAGGRRVNAQGDRIVDFFDVHAADLKSVLRQLSMYSGVDIVSSDAAKATVSVTVSNKSWREILAIVCMVHNLSVVQEESFVYVMTKDEAAARNAERAAALAASGAGVVHAPVPGAFAAPQMPPSMVGNIGDPQVFAPLVREVIPLKFTTAGEMTPTITPFLSPRGKLTPVQHTNSLIIVDTDDNLLQLRQLIEQIDVQTAQISISCKIIEVTSGVIQRMGVHLGFSDEVGNGQIGGGQLWNTPEGIVGDAMHRISYGMLGPRQLTAALEYLFQDNKAEVVAQPQITTLNNKEARIFMGQQIPINRVDEGGNTVTDMVTSGTELIVTPYVSGEGKIMLSLKPKKESYVLIGESNSPIINEQSAETNVLVNNGETVVIAGLTSNEKMETETGIPILKNIPIIGNLFKRSSKTVDKRDLVIFVTPNIIHPGI